MSDLHQARPGLVPEQGLFRPLYHVVELKRRFLGARLPINAPSEGREHFTIGARSAMFQWSRGLLTECSAEGDPVSPKGKWFTL